jgi:hypothetical protein
MQAYTFIKVLRLLFNTAARVLPGQAKELGLLTLTNGPGLQSFYEHFSLPRTLLLYLV